MRSGIFVAYLAAFIWFSTSESRAEIYAGVASVDITPDVVKYKVPMAGYGARQGKPSTGVHDPLFANVLYLRDGATVMAIVTADLRSSTPDLKNQVLAKCDGLGLTRENLMIAASHNHSGPSFFPEKFWQLQFGEFDPAILVEMSARIAEGLAAAAKSAAPARVGFAEKDLPEFTRNRRWEYDTAAREAANETPALSSRLFVMRIDGDAGEPIAILVNFGTHPTILGADNFELSAEWPGAMRREIERAFPNATALYTNGAEGDQAPANAQGENGFARVEDFGSRLAAEVIALAKTIKTEPATIAFAFHEAPIGEPVFSEAAKNGQYAFMQPMAMEVLPRTAELQQFRIGGVVLAGLPGEPIADVGRKTERSLVALGAETAITVSLANDYIGYILNAKEYAHGGYEVDSRSFYGPGLGDLIARETALSGRTLFAQAKTTGEKINLFNGKNFDGWKLFIPDPSVDTSKVWSVQEGGVIRCEGKPAGYMRTEKEYENYRVTLEWRWPAAPGNNGLLLHCQLPDEVWPKSLEAQMYHENAGDIWVIGGADYKEHVDKSTRQTVKMHPHNEKPLGEWNHFEAVCDGDTILLYVNGLLQHKATQCTLSKGFIALQSEGAIIEYRNIVLEPLAD